MFQSFYTISFNIVVISILISVLILKKTPYQILSYVIGRLINNKKALLHFGALFLILYLNKLELKFESNLPSNDYTDVIHNIEGDIVYYIQQFFLNDQLTWILTFFYIIVFTSLMIASLIIYLYINDDKSFYSFIYAIMLNYSIAIPFFIFFPIYEVWYYDSTVQFLIPQVYPNFELEYRKLSGINNNFPSLHTAISSTIALIAFRSKSKAFAKLTIVSAGLIIFSTIYLGIHWISDLLAGLLLAVFVTYAGDNLYKYSLSENKLYE